MLHVTHKQNLKVIAWKKWQSYCYEARVGGGRGRGRGGGGGGGNM